MEQNNEIAKQVQDIELTATVPLEMINAQQQLITWCDGKLSLLKKESEELLEAFTIAKNSNWNCLALLSQYNKSLKRISYYEKIKSALVEGYYIVPNFPIQMFAIKTKSKKPKADFNTIYWGAHQQSAQQLNAGEGEYKNPFPIIKQRNIFEDGKETKGYWADDWNDLEFPITMAKPRIMEATNRAMALKIFDQIGIMPAAKKEDPVIIGQIFRKESYTQKLVSFMIAWHLNTNVL